MSLDFKSILLVLAYLSISLVLIESRRECIGRKGKDTTYCVCNTTYCDDLDVISRQAKGSVVMYQTSIGGDRFKESRLKFSSKVSPPDSHIELKVDRSVKHQKMFGIGVAFTDAAVINMDTLPKDMANHLIRDYFSSTGIEFSIARIPIAGTDFSTRIYTYDDSTHEDFELKNWKLAEEDIKHKIPNIKLAQSVSPHKVKFFGSPWVTPSWLNNRTALKKDADKHYHTWANYFVKFLDAYKEHGINVWGTTMQNEPMSFSSMNFLNASIERDFVKKHLGPALVKAGYTKDKFNLMVYDDGSAKNPVIPYVETVLNDSEAHKYVNGIAYHCYYGGNYSWISELQKKFPDQFVLMTECCQNFRLNTEPPTPSALGDWGHARGYISGVMNTLKKNVVGWVEWNLALDIYGHPNRDKKAADAPLLIDAQKKEYYKNPNFYALGHYSKFIAPDSIRVEVSSSKVQRDFDFVAVERPDNSTALIVYNLGNKPIDILISDSKEGQFVTKINENTIQSFIYWN